MARVTVERPQMKLHDVPDNQFASYLFDYPTPPREVPNVRDVSWDRSIDQDAAECTVTLWNVKPLELGEQPTSDDLNQLGYYTPSRGTTEYSSRWDHEPNEWVNLLVPDNIIKTYEGYGFDANACPSEDPNLVITGVWRIDTVEFTHAGDITITCRDLASILMDQIAYPPVVPFEAGPKTNEFPRGKYAYPVQFEGVQPQAVISHQPLSPQEVPLSFDDSSNTPYVSSKDASVYGHRPSEAFDDDNGTFWWSIGNARPDQGYSFEWIQGKCSNTTVSSVKWYSWGTEYTVYASVFADGEWVNVGGIIPYDPDHPASAPNGSDIPFVASTYAPPTQGAERAGELEIVFPEPIENVTKVRLTFTNLWYSATGTYKYRADCREMRAFGGQLTREVRTQADIKNYNDYTDIVKLFLAWGGFFWPGDNAVTKACDGTTVEHTFSQPDDAMPLQGSGGRVWGDFKLAGTAGPSPLDVDIWEKKPLLECIRYVADILGYLAYVDETGGFVFRPPNIYRVGNLLRSLSRDSGVYLPGNGNLIRIDEKQVLESLTATLDGANLRERVFIANSDASQGHMAQGWNPNPTGLRRVGGWTDQHFSTPGECKVMAEMITLRQLFTYRTDSLTIPGNPRIQVDDQLRIFERTTSEGFVHYVRSISSSNNLETGEWTYKMDTHWLGEDPFRRWAFDKNQLSEETKRFLDYIYGSPEEVV